MAAEWWDKVLGKFECGADLCTPLRSNYADICEPAGSQMSSAEVRAVTAKHRAEREESREMTWQLQNLQVQKTESTSPRRKMAVTEVTASEHTEGVLGDDKRNSSCKKYTAVGDFQESRERNLPIGQERLQNDKKRGVEIFIRAAEQKTSEQGMYVFYKASPETIKTKRVLGSRGYMADRDLESALVSSRASLNPRPSPETP